MDVRDKAMSQGEELIGKWDTAWTYFGEKKN